MGKDKGADLLRHAAVRASKNMFFLAADLSEFQKYRRMNETQLAGFLGCPEGLLSKLALCRRPDPGSERFQMDIKRIAEAFSFGPTRLFQLMREVDALRAFKQARRGIEQEGTDGLLIAARDQEPDNPVKKKPTSSKVEKERKPT